jgi:hypothetical protein
MITPALARPRAAARIQRLYAAYGPLARSSVDALAGSPIDLACGVVLASLIGHLGLQ